MYLLEYFAFIRCFRRLNELEVKYLKIPLEVINNKYLLLSYYNVFIPEEMLEWDFLKKRLNFRKGKAYLKNINAYNEIALNLNIPKISETDYMLRFNKFFIRYAKEFPEILDKRKYHDKPKNMSVNTWVKSKLFLDSYIWTKLRMKTLIKYGRKCSCCGIGPNNNKGIYIQVDHIKSRLHHPELALSEENLQVMCNICNKGKSNWDSTNWQNLNPRAKNDNKFKK